MRLCALAVAFVLAAACATTRPAPPPKQVSRAKSTGKWTAPKPKPAPEPAAGGEAKPPASEAQSADEEDTPAETGLASYYADNLAGSRTASGERYRPEQATCAHRTYPFGTLIDVTVVGSGLTATCRVNDRGPWADGRVVDVSKKVAQELGMLGPGVLEVTVRKHED